MVIADHRAEVKNHAPKPTKMAKQNTKIAVFTFSFQKRCDLKIRNATTAYHVKSQSQWTIVNIVNPVKPKTWALSISVVPMVSHHSMKPGLAAVVHIPASRDSCRGRVTFWVALCLFLNVLMPRYIMSKPPTAPTAMGMASGMVYWLSQK